jgi:CheY-like chemotaxis protein
MMAPTVAVLDHDPSFLSLMHEVLTDEGFIPLLWRARDTADVQALLRRAQPDLFIVAAWLADRDESLEVLARLRGDHDTAHIPAIVLTEQPEAPTADYDLPHQMPCLILRKPFDIVALLSTIAMALDPAPAMRASPSVVGMRRE